MDLFSIVYVAKPEEAAAMAEAGADAVIAHVGTTVGDPWRYGAVCSWKMPRTLPGDIRQLERSIPTFSFPHGGPINTPEDATQINQMTDAQGFVGAPVSNMGVEESLTNLTRTFKQIPLSYK